LAKTAATAKSHRVSAASERPADANLVEMIEQVAWVVIDAVRAGVDGSGHVHPVGLLVLSLAGTRISELTWFIGSRYMQPFGLPSAPFVDERVSTAL
jgi:hypothetical protein